MKTVLKWPGGKEKELPVIRNCTPEYAGRYVEPFVGGGAVYFDVDTVECCINDRSEDLINLYNCIKEQNEDFIAFLQKEVDEFATIGTFCDRNREQLLAIYFYQLSVEDFIQRHDIFNKLADDHHMVFLAELKKNLTNKLTRVHKLEAQKGELSEQDKVDNMETAIRSAYYMYIRYLYNYPKGLNRGKKAAVFYFVREYCYSSMFRYNSQGAFNVPYGGMSYNRKNFKRKVEHVLSEEVHKKFVETEISCLDFEPFLENLNLTEEDFIFLDPPYDTDFSTYDKNEFGKREQERLCEFLKRTPAKILLIIKNTDFIYNLYKENFHVQSFDKKYMVSFMNRNSKDVTHLIITNY